MNTLKTDLKEAYFKKKVCLLGGLEEIKNQFQDYLSSSTLSMENKRNIGVNISKVDLFSQNHNFEYFLWNINCSREKAFLRTTFYTGAEACIVLISENKVEQIIRYFHEIKTRIPIVTIIFCVVLNDKTAEEVQEAYFNSANFTDLIRTEQFRINIITHAREIFAQISDFFLKKVESNCYDDNFVVDFISIDKLSEKKNLNYDCDDYYEPTQGISHERCRINTKALKHYLQNLNIEYEQMQEDWINIYNPNYGTFSIFLRNGNVYYTPKMCENCKDKKCMKRRRTENFICIEARTEGWSNIIDLGQKELLLLSKILILKHASEESIPLSIIEQINKYRECLRYK
jgi:hypothetical protein